MGKVNVYDIDGKPKGEVSVDTIPEGFEPDQLLIARSLKRQMANARIPSAHTKTRAQVRGGGGKMYRQKGTGRARHGTIRAVQFRGGGVVFGPTSQRNFKLGMNKKERGTALRHLVWSRIQAGEWLLFGDLGLEEPSTRRAKAFLKALGRDGKILVLLPNDERFDVIRKSLRNLRDVTILPPERLNTFDLLNSRTILAHEAAFESVRNTWGI